MFKGITLNGTPKGQALSILTTCSTQEFIEWDNANAKGIPEWDRAGWRKAVDMAKATLLIHNAFQA